jgi:colanic acid biosynthesis glycosyl transferase WcaI
MRIIILSINYWPEQTGIGPFTTYRAEYLASVGHDVTVCTTFPYYPDWRIEPQYRGKLFERSERNGVRILRTRIYVPKSVTNWKRVLHEATFALGSFVGALGCKRPDLLFVTSPPLGLGICAVLLSVFWRVRYVFDVMDLQPDAAAELGMLPGRVLNWMYRIEKISYRRAELISTLTNGMRDKILKKGFDEGKVVLFEPQADQTLLKVTPSEGQAFRERHGLEGKLLVTHSGNLGMKQGLDVILEAAEMSQSHDRLLFLIVGNGAARKRLELRVAELKLENVRFLPLLEEREFHGLLAASDICLITQRKATSDIVFPSKLVTYLAAGCAVIASTSSDGEVARTIRESRAGLVIEPERPRALRDAILGFRPEKIRECRLSARAYARSRWSPERVLNFMESRLVALSAASSEHILGRDVDR